MDMYPGKHVTQGLLTPTVKKGVCFPEEQLMEWEK